MGAASITTPIGKIFQPLLDFVGAVLAFFYSIVPNYPIDVALLTIVIMAALTPLTVKSTKNMAAMQALGPEMKKLQQKYKGADNRAQMNEEMMKLYKEHNVNPASGCLPMLLQMPAFFILYSVIRGMTNTVTKGTIIPGTTQKCAQAVCAIPRYIPTSSKMYHNIVASHGQLISFGMDFSDKLLSHHSTLFVAIPYLVLVIGAVGLQYLQMSRLNARNPQAAQANPQAAMMQKYMPLIFGFIYLNVAAILNIYFIVSSAIRILTQEILFRKGIVAGPPPAPAVGAAGGGGKSGGATGGGAKSGGAKKGPAADRTERALPKPKTTSATAKSTGSANGTNGKGGQGGKTTPRPSTQKKVTGSANGANARKSAGTRNGSTGQSNARRSSNGSNGSGSADAESDSPAPKEHPRSKAKRERKAR
jgi:YidC/Oxa1 family membrane protein insertase